jgi:N-acyl-phosphatidylethanolamine-hydrolysing phospholipase D
VFSKCSINDYLGPKRLRPIPCELEDIKDKIDIVIVSHDHFDHLGNNRQTDKKKKKFYNHFSISDEAAVRKLGNTVTWYIPLGLKHWFLKRNIHTVRILFYTKTHYKPILK